MSNHSCGIEFEIMDTSEVMFCIEDNNEKDFIPGDTVIVSSKIYYDKLQNLPTIGGRTIVGDQTISYYLQDGLILNGGNATGYDLPPVVTQETQEG